MGEGFGDYFAASVAGQLSGGFQDLCLADWDATSYSSSNPPCQRRLDGTKHYPESVVGEVHDDGEIWSRALWDIRNAVGHTKADTLILQGSFDFPGTTMTDLANRTVAAAQSLYGTATAKAVRKAFQDRGIL